MSFSTHCFPSESRASCSHRARLFSGGGWSVPALGEGAELRSCKDSKCLPELGWSLTCAGQEGEQEEVS